MDELELELKQCFLEEAAQLLAGVEEAVLELESGRSSPELIARIFRLAHTFKGTGSAVGFAALAGFAHQLENVLACAQSGTMAVDARFCAAVLAGVDELQAYTKGLRADLNHHRDTSAIERQLAELLQAEPVAEVPLAETPEVPGVVEPVGSLKPVRVAAEGDADESIRVSSRKLDRLLNLVGEVVVGHAIVAEHRARGSLESEPAQRALVSVERSVDEVRAIALSLRMAPVAPVFQRMRRVARDAARAESKAVELVCEGDHVEMDKTVLERIVDPLTHLVRNAVGHGIESPEARKAAGKPPVARVTLRAEQQEDRIRLELGDDGGGLHRDRIVAKAVAQGLVKPGETLTDERVWSLIFLPGFSTAEKVTELSGRGVGLDVVRETVESLGGEIITRSKPGQGTVFEILLPLSLSIVPGLVVEADGISYVLPVGQLLETIEFDEYPIRSTTSNGRFLNFRGEIIPYLSLREVFRGPGKEDDTPRTGVVIHSRGRTISIGVDRILGRQQVVLKKLGAEVAQINGVVAGAVLSNGEPGLVLKLDEMARVRRVHGR